MIRPVVVVWLVVAACMAAGVYLITYRTSQARAELAETRTRIAEHREALRVLRAEWSYLARPERIGRLARERLNMRPVRPGRTARVETVPPRVVRGMEPARERGELTNAADSAVLPHRRPWSLDPAEARGLAAGGDA